MFKHKYKKASDARKVEESVSVVRTGGYFKWPKWIPKTIELNVWGWKRGGDKSGGVCAREAIDGLENKREKGWDKVKAPLSYSTDGVLAQQVWTPGFDPQHWEKKEKQIHSIQVWQGQKPLNLEFRKNQREGGRRLLFAEMMAKVLPNFIKTISPQN